ncbi:MAG: hypothetical protein ISN28_09785 [Ectothiorhodospiraceae bacterium AqS1]|nr:hypothetical protein [Ectothiorhodospiraceae bacterium AqS1]
MHKWHLLQTLFNLPKNLAQTIEAGLESISRARADLAIRPSSAHRQAERKGFSRRDSAERSITPSPMMQRALEGDRISFVSSLRSLS